MADEHVDDITVQMAVAAAIASAGPSGANTHDWYKRVMTKIPQAAAWIAAGSRPFELAKQVAEAQHFTGILRGVEIEESSKRGIISLANRNGEIEKLRTNPQWSPHGKAIYDALQRVQVGSLIMVWKAIENVQGDATKKVRVVVHFEVLRGPEDAAQGQVPTQPPEREGAGRAPEEEPSISPPVPPVPNEDPRREAIRENIKAAKNPARIKAEFKKLGWTKAADIPEADLEKALFMSLHEGEEPF
jgi:hypothetical protein